MAVLNVGRFAGSGAVHVPERPMTRSAGAARNASISSGALQVDYAQNRIRNAAC